MFHDSLNSGFKKISIIVVEINHYFYVDLFVALEIWEVPRLFS